MFLYVCAKNACESVFVSNNAYHSCAHSHIKYTYMFSMCIKTLIYVFLCARISYGILKRRVMKSVPFKKFRSEAQNIWGLLCYEYYVFKDAHNICLLIYLLLHYKNKSAICLDWINVYKKERIKEHLCHSKT